MAAQTIVIVGAGVGGLTAALSFARHGYHVTVFEQAPELSEVGAGLQISPNASRILINLGLGDGLRQTMVCAQQITLVSGSSLHKIAHVPGGDFAMRRWGAPYGVMHRADLQNLLRSAVQAHPLCSLRLGQQVTASGYDDLKPLAGDAVPALVVGADGVWSKLRRLVDGAASPRFSGQVAWRFKMPVEATREVLNPGNVTVFLGADAHLVAYPLAGGAWVNMVAITRGSDPGPTWAARDNPTERASLLRAFGDWHPDLVAILRKAPEMTWWPLFEVPDGRWSDGQRLMLIGDAAHAMTPFAAQGAAMAIEDGFELAQAFASAGPDLGATLAGYESRRRARIAQARNRAAFNKFAYHARGPVRLGRDLVLALRGPESLAGDLDWLYGYRSSGT